MAVYMLESVPIYADDRISETEAKQYAVDEMQRWRARGKRLAHIRLQLDGDEVIITATEKSPIRRIRRITGYLSTVDHFNDAKRAELEARVRHI